MINNNITLILLIVAFVADISLLAIILKSVAKNQIRKIFSGNLVCLVICIVGQIAQILFADRLGINPIYFDYIVYIGTCFLPITVFFTGLVFANTKITFKKKYLLLFIIPIISLLVLWTNDYHHLFYIHYSTNIATTEYGPYMTIHNIYSYTLLIIGILYMLKFSIKNSGFFSKQSILIVLGMSTPVIVNILGTYKIIPMKIYVTPITFTIAILCFALAIFKFKFLSIAPIALQTVVDKISDGYLVINEDNKIIDFNKTFLILSKMEDSYIRNKNIFDLVENTDLSIKTDELNKLLLLTKKTNKTQTINKYFEKLNKYFHIEFSSLNNKQSFIGTLILFKDITQHTEDMKTIKDNQESLMESERLASLGQLIGGIAHNLKTPIMSISGATEALQDLTTELDKSIGNPLVTDEDFHDIAKDFSNWISKIRDYTEYMSDVITAVKGQAVTLSETENNSFDLEELVKRVDILMKHELKNAIIYLSVKMYVDSKLIIHGDVNSLVQVINNMISNSIQAYNGRTEEEIELEFKKENENLVISVADHASGLPKKVQEKLFKEMITTKGKNGTGLGLYMSYSTIKAHFNGNITLESEEGKGTRFNIILPLFSN